MITVLCLLKSGGIYTPEWVEKLRDGVARHMSPHHFVCLSDVEVPCDRIALEHNWPGWWSKIEIFSRRVISGPTLYLDLDTVVVRGIDSLADLPHDFAMLRNFSDPTSVGSGVMWFKSVPHLVYDTFVDQPQFYMSKYAMKAGVNGSHVGDQAFIRDTLGEVPQIDNPIIKSYKKHCWDGFPSNAAMVCFHGAPRPDQSLQPWVKEHWK